MPRARMFPDLFPCFFWIGAIAPRALVAFLKFKCEFFDDLCFLRAGNAEWRQIFADVGFEVRHFPILRRAAGRLETRSSSSVAPTAFFGRQPLTCNISDAVGPKLPPSSLR